MIAWWDHEIVNPDEIRIRVFNKGISKGLKVEIPLGGQIRPISILGDNLAWKNLQKNPRKKNTSEVINKIMPQRNPIVTLKVCNPWNVLSRIISRHHWYITKELMINPNINKFFSCKWNHLIRPIIVVNIPNELIKGQGL